MTIDSTTFPATVTDPPARSLDFDRIVAETQAAIRAYIAGLGTPPHEVDDRAQEVYLELYRGELDIPEGVTPLRWLKGIAKKICLNEFRRRSRRRDLDREALAELLDRTESRFDDSPPTLRTDGGVGDFLDDCLRTLVDDRRELIEARYRDDQTSEEIASRIGSTAAAVRTALRRVRDALRDCVTARMEAMP